MKNALKFAVLFLVALTAACDFVKREAYEAITPPNFRKAEVKKPGFLDAIADAFNRKQPRTVASAPLAPASTSVAVQVPTGQMTLSSIIHSASAAEGPPIDIIYAVKRKESGKTLNGNFGNCNALEQLEIFCHHRESACQHVEALKAMAKIHNWNLKKVRGSCGSSTWDNDTKWHGGAIGYMQTLPAFFFKGEYRKQDPFQPYWAIHHAASVLQKSYNASKASTPKEKWERAIRSYVGDPTGDVSEGYYKEAVTEGWTEATRWRKAGMFDTCVDQPSQLGCRCLLNPKHKRCRSKGIVVATN